MSNIIQCVHCGLHYDKRLSDLYPCVTGKEHYYRSPDEEYDKIMIGLTIAILLCIVISKYIMSA